MTQIAESHSTADLLDRAVTASRDVVARLTQHVEGGDGMTALEQSARGTALIHELRQHINELDKLLPFKG
ncbi:hypothetical protein KIH27_04540 [Mycobacterium sp. M1]|uniref:Uncharacterized protein n=1 Tax=Mycolicibacter acidiphilus TaxID=2835306 RepID=A0ABS5RGU5_9MYCO|nr:hypothetical protein [Mycolicibacter acidiphilus]MBS9532854.1 hypothetical protein [Mycolicibacter acidiphilus]